MGKQPFPLVWNLYFSVHKSSDFKVYRDTRNFATIRKGGLSMRSIFRSLAPVLLAAAIAAPVLTTGCAVHARIYDPYYHDYHVWATEEPYYSQWEHDTHREHRDFDKRSADEQKNYWDWRHKQEGHDDHH